MKTNQLLIGALILVGGYVVYTRFIKKPKDESNDAKNGKEIGTEPQQTNPNVQQTPNPSERPIPRFSNPRDASAWAEKISQRLIPSNLSASFMDFDGELDDL
jgi:hypothetical protein